MGSDHFPIEIILNSPPQNYLFFSQKINHSKIDWDLFDEYLQDNENKIDNFPDELTAPQKYQEIIDTIMKAIDYASPNSIAKQTPSSKSFTKSKKGTLPAPWWNETCSKMVALRRKSYSHFRKSPSWSYYLTMKKQVALSKLTIKKEKLKGWANFCASINRTTPIKTIWQRIKAFKNRRSHHPNLIAKNDTESADQMKEFINSFCPNLPEDYTPPPPPDSTFKAPEFLEKEYTFEEFQTALDATKKSSSPGLDKIDYKIINKLPVKYKKTLLQIYNEIIEHSQFPSGWRNFMVYLLPKDSPGKFRPISLASCLLKLLERMVLTRLLWWIERNHLLPTNQYGFRSMRSCADNLAILTTEILTGFSSNQYVPCVFLDVKGAFDNVDPTTLFLILVKLGFPKRIAHFAYFLTAFRILFFVINGKLVGPFPATKGLGQGSVLSTIFYDLYVAALSINVSPIVDVVNFADDIGAFTRSTNLKTALKNLEKVLKKIIAHLNSLGLQISPEKSKLVIFSRKHYVGFAMHVPALDLSSKFKISSYASIYTAEALAIHTALQTIKDQNLPKALVITDSLSVLHSLQCFSPAKNASYIIHQILQLLNELILSGRDVHFLWTPSHINLTGNERADGLARKAIHSGELLDWPLPFTNYHELVNRKMKDDTAEILRRQAVSKGAHYFANYYKGWRAPWFSQLKLDRPQITLINRIRSNHHNLNSSLFRKDIIDSPLCLCGQEENLHHVLWACPLYASERKPLLNAFKRLNISALNFNKTIDSPSEKIVYLIYNYFKSIKRNI